jgi:hypothetical protein
MEWAPVSANKSGLNPAVTTGRAGNDKSSDPPGTGKLNFYQATGQLATIRAIALLDNAVLAFASESRAGWVNHDQTKQACNYGSNQRI